jgi:hypothetical protein
LYDRLLNDSKLEAILLIFVLSPLMMVQSPPAFSFRPVLHFLTIHLKLVKGLDNHHRLKIKLKMADVTQLGGVQAHGSLCLNQAPDNIFTLSGTICTQNGGDDSSLPRKFRVEFAS